MGPHSQLNSQSGGNSVLEAGPVRKQSLFLALQREVTKSTPQAPPTLSKFFPEALQTVNTEAGIQPVKAPVWLHCHQSWASCSSLLWQPVSSPTPAGALGFLSALTLRESGVSWSHGVGHRHVRENRICPFLLSDAQQCPLSMKAYIQGTEALCGWRGTTQPRSDGTVEKPNGTDYLWSLRPNRNCTFSFFVKGYNSAIT